MSNYKVSNGAYRFYYNTVNDNNKIYKVIYRDKNNDDNVLWTLGNDVMYIIDTSQEEEKFIEIDAAYAEKDNEFFKPDYKPDDNWEFLGWTTSKTDVSGDVLLKGEAIINDNNVEQDIVVYAVYKKPVTLTYHGNGADSPKHYTWSQRSGCSYVKIEKRNENNCLNFHYDTYGKVNLYSCVLLNNPIYFDETIQEKTQYIVIETDFEVHQPYGTRATGFEFSVRMRTDDPGNIVLKLEQTALYRYINSTYGYVKKADYEQGKNHLKIMIDKSNKKTSYYLNGVLVEGDLPSRNKTNTNVGQIRIYTPAEDNYYIKELFLYNLKVYELNTEDTGIVHVNEDYSQYDEGVGLDFTIGAGGITDCKTMFYNNNNTATPVFTLAKNIFSKDNHSFIEWNLGDVGNTILLDTNTTAYAQWIETIKEIGYTGEPYEFIVPADGDYLLEAWGAQGGSKDSQYSKTFISQGGKGGYSWQKVSLKKGDILYICVGGKGLGLSTEYISKTDSNGKSMEFYPGGYNGGGNGYQYWLGGSSGGGATHILLRSELIKDSNFTNFNLLDSDDRKKITLPGLFNLTHEIKTPVDINGNYPENYDENTWVDGGDHRFRKIIEKPNFNTIKKAILLVAGGGGGACLRYQWDSGIEDESGYNLIFTRAGRDSGGSFGDKGYGQYNGQTNEEGIQNDWQTTGANLYSTRKSGLNRISGIKQTYLTFSKIVSPSFGQGGGIDGTAILYDDDNSGTAAAVGGGGGFYGGGASINSGSEGTGLVSASGGIGYFLNEEGGTLMAGESYKDKNNNYITFQGNYGNGKARISYLGYPEETNSPYVKTPIYFINLFTKTTFNDYYVEYAHNNLQRINDYNWTTSSSGWSNVTNPSSFEERGGVVYKKEYFESEENDKCVMIKTCKEGDAFFSMIGTATEHPRVGETIPFRNGKDGDEIVIEFDIAIKGEASNTNGYEIYLASDTDTYADEWKHSIWDSSNILYQFHLKNNGFYTRASADGELSTNAFYQYTKGNWAHFKIKINQESKKIAYYINDELKGSNINAWGNDCYFLGLSFRANKPGESATNTNGIVDNSLFIDNVLIYTTYENGE